MKFSRVTAIKLGLVAGICFMLGLLASTQMPKVRSYILVKIEQTSRDHLPVRILPSTIQVSLLPLGATLQNVEIVAKDEVKEFFDAASFKEISVSISPWQLLNGKLRLTEISVNGAKISGRLPPSKKKSGPPLEGLFDTIAQIPINEISLKDTSIRLGLAEPKMVLDIHGLELSVEKKRQGRVAVDLTQAAVTAISTDPNLGKGSVRVELEGALLAAPKAVEITDFKIRRGNSYANVSGAFEGDVEALKFHDFEAKAESDLNLESIRNWLAKTFPEKNNLPKLAGHIKLTTEVARKDNGPLDANAKLEAENFKIDHFLLGTIETAGTLKSDEAKIPKVTLTQSAGSLELNDTTVRLGNEKSFTTNLKIGSVELHELLLNLGVGDIPVRLDITGDTPCAGKFGEGVPTGFSMSCKGSMRGANILVQDAPKLPANKGVIVAFKEFAAKGDFTVDAEKVTYSAELNMPNSQGRSSGTIGYATGFKIAYEADKLSFSDVSNFANLKFEGSGRIKGVTEGDSHKATINAEVEATDLWFEDFWLGNPKAKVSYLAGTLGFSDIQGYYTVSRYAGDVALDLRAREITVNARAPFFNAQDILKVFSKKVTLPFAVTGTGQGSIRLSGPLELSRMSYELKTSLFRGTIANENFDQANFDVKSVGGEVAAQRVQVIKGNSAINLTGNARPDGSIKTVVSGRNIRLEDSSIISASGLALSGQMDFTMDMNGPILSPDTDLKGHLTQTSLGDQSLPDSNFNLVFTSKTLNGQGNFLGDALKASFKVPFDAASPFQLKVSAKDFNYTPLFSAISGQGSRKDFDGKLSCEIDLEAATGGFWNSTGSIRFDDFRLARGSLALKSSEPIAIHVDQGQININKFDLSGENVFIRVSSNPRPTSKLDLQVNGKVDMTLLGILLPFFEDLRGVASTSFSIRAGERPVELLGSAYIEKGYLKFFDFPHPIEDLRVDLLFNQRKILFNTVKAEFGGGRISGSGGLELKGYKDYPLNLSAAFEKVSVNIPEKVKTTGSGNLSLTGSWFPFLMKIDYNVREGMVTREFTSEGGISQSARRDQFLPDMLLQERFIPLLLDLGVNFQKGIEIRNDIIEGTAFGEINVRGNPAKPAITGLVSLEKLTKIYFKDTPFEVTTANIQMNDPNDLNPKLYVDARARVQEYDVTLIVQGTANKPEFALSSVPALSEKDIISLLALGATESDLNTKVNTSEQSTQSGIQVGSSALKNNALSKQIKERFGFDVQFSPSFDETNAVQKIVVSRQVTPKFGVAASQSLGKTRGTDAEMRYKFNSKFSGVVSWQTREESETVEQVTNPKDPNTLGLDLEYKFEFK